MPIFHNRKQTKYITMSNTYIDKSAKIGKNNIIYPYVYIGPNVEIGDNNTIYPFTSIGTPGEHRTADGPDDGKTIIGNNNVIRESVTIQAPVGTQTTIIKDNCYIMNKCHIAHDCIVEDGVTMSTGSIIGGHTIVRKYANLGLGSVTRQRLVIGESAMIGMNSTITKNILPFSTVMGSPARIKCFNRVGAIRREFEEDYINSVNDEYRLIVLQAENIDADDYISTAIKEFYEQYENVLYEFSSNI